MSETAKEKEEKEHSKKRSKWKIVLPLIFLLILAAGYAVTAVYFQSHFYPCTQINGIDCSNEDAVFVEERLAEEYVSYTLTVYGRDRAAASETAADVRQTSGGELSGREAESVLGILNVSDLGLCTQSREKEVAELLTAQKSILWPRMFFDREYRYEIPVQILLDHESLETALEEWESFQVSRMEKPRDAYLGEYNEEKKSYEIVPETKGNLVDWDRALALIEQAALHGSQECSLEDGTCYQTAVVTRNDTTLQKLQQILNKWVGARITYDWNGNEVVVDADLIHQWISVRGGIVELDEEAVAEFVKENAKAADTYGRKVNFVTTAGLEVVLPNGGYGWKTDCSGETQELIELICSGSVVDREPLYLRRGAYKGSDDIGNSYVEIDLTNQHLYLYNNGEMVLETDFVSGDVSKGRATPWGVYGLTYKTREAVLRGADYVTPVHYWMPFNGDVGMHDATWRSEFGGDIYLTNGSHGCVNLPLDKAKEIYEYVSTGFPVICYY